VTEIAKFTVGFAGKLRAHSNALGGRPLRRRAATSGPAGADAALPDLGLEDARRRVSAGRAVRPVLDNLLRGTADRAALGGDGSRSQLPYHLCKELKLCRLSENDAVAFMDIERADGGLIVCELLRSWLEEKGIPGGAQEIRNAYRNSPTLPTMPPLPLVPGFSSGDPAPTPESAAPTEIETTIARLAALDPVSYELSRKSMANTLGLRTAVLDKAVAAQRGARSGNGAKQGGALGLAAPEPWPESVDGADLLDAVSEFFARHLILPAGAADLLGAWTIHTHCHESARHTPRLAITSPEKQCGKTTVLDLLALVVSKPLATANVTAAAVFRTVEAFAPTLLVDEADTFLGENEGLRGVLNAGHKRGGQVLRCVGDDAEPRTFAAFAPAAIASIGALPGTIADRSIAVVMRRATRMERPQPIRRATEAEGAELARKAARFAADHAAVLQDLEPALPDGMTNRVADNWRILFAIAEVAGGAWPSRLARAAEALANADDGREGPGVGLLRDVRTVFETTGVARLPTAEIVGHLVAMEDRPWPEIKDGKALSTTRFTRMLKPFGIFRQQWRVEKTDFRQWGFYAKDFSDAFARYLPPSDDRVKTGDPVTRQEI
jgi:hypothetical protein